MFHRYLRSVVISVVALPLLLCLVWAQPVEAQASRTLSPSTYIGCTASFLNGFASVTTGVIGVRANASTAIGSGTLLIESYISVGALAFYRPMGVNPTGGFFNNAGGFYNQTLAPGTQVTGCAYHALSAAFGSWDGGAVANMTANCSSIASLPVNQGTSCKSVTGLAIAYPNVPLTVNVWQSQVKRSI